MSVTSGFFNSLNGDRRYNAEQMSAIFDGIINDGVFANIGESFAVKADTGDAVTVGIGKAWFNSAWVYNDAILPITLDVSEILLDRYDAIIIEVDHGDLVRDGSIKVIKGTPSSDPMYPAMANTTTLHQYPLAYIHRKASSEGITQADIINAVGTDYCPFITGILQVQSIDMIVARWEAQWNQWFTAQMYESDTSMQEWMDNTVAEFNIWFTQLQELLTENAEAEMAADILELQARFDDLMKDQSIYETIDDSNGDSILGSDGTALEGKTVLTAGGHVTSGPSGNIVADDIIETATRTFVTPQEKYLINHSVQNESDPNVPTWAKQPTKPTYNVSEIDGGTFKGEVVANAASSENYVRKQVRNIFLVASGSSLPEGANGDICLVYTP